MHSPDVIRKVQEARKKQAELAELIRAADEENEILERQIARGNYRLQDGCHNCEFWHGYCDERAYAPVDEAGICDLYRKKEE